MAGQNRRELGSSGTGKACGLALREVHQINSGAITRQRHGISHSVSTGAIDEWRSCLQAKEADPAPAAKPLQYPTTIPRLFGGHHRLFPEEPVKRTALKCIRIGAITEESASSVQNRAQGSADAAKAAARPVKMASSHQQFRITRRRTRQPPDQWLLGSDRWGIPEGQVASGK